MAEPEAKKLQKLTLTVPGDLILKAKHKTVDEGTSISRVVTACLREYVEPETAGVPAPKTATEGGTERQH